MVDLLKGMSKSRFSEHISHVKAYFSMNSCPITAQRQFLTKNMLKSTDPGYRTIKKIDLKDKKYVSTPQLLHN